MKKKCLCLLLLTAALVLAGCGTAPQNTVQNAAQSTAQGSAGQAAVNAAENGTKQESGQAASSGQVDTITPGTKNLTGGTAAGSTAAANTTGQSTGSPADSSAAGTAAASAVYDDNLIENVIEEDGTYKDDVGNEMDYTYHVPHLVVDTADAEAVNADIDSAFGKNVKDSMSDMKKGYSLWYFNVEWKSYWHGSTLCLVVSSNEEGDFTDYRVYNYDFAAGKKLTNTELLQQTDLDTDTLVSKTYAIAKAQLKKDYADLKAMLGRKEYQKLFDRTLTDKNINKDMMTYVDDSGTVNVIIQYASAAGADWYYKVFQVK